MPRPRSAAAAASSKPKPKARPRPRTYNNTKPTYSRPSLYRPRMGNQYKNDNMLSLNSAQRLLSPFLHVKPPPSNSSLGNFTTYNGISRHVLLTSTTHHTVLIYQPSVRGVYGIAQWNADTGTVGSIDNSPLYRFASSDTPISTRPMRGALRIRNTTSNQDISGLVQVLSISSPLEFEFTTPTALDITTTFAAELRAMCASNPKSREFTARELSVGQNEFVSSPACFSDYNSYGKHMFTTTTTAAGLQAEYDNVRVDMPMNIIIVMFPPSSVINSYSITIGQQNAMRYPTNVLLGEMSTPHDKPRNPKLLETAHELVAKSGSTPLTDRGPAPSRRFGGGVG